MNTGNNLLYLVVSALLAFMALTGVVGKRNIEGVTVAVLPPEEIYAGQPALLQLRLTNRRRLLPAFFLRVAVAGSESRALALACGETLTLPLFATFPRRGRVDLATARIGSPFPVRFFTRGRDLTLATSVVVFPAPVSGGEGGGDGRSATVTSDGRQRRGHDGEVVHIGDYSGREPLRQIHWKLSARHDDLKVKRHGGRAVEPLLIDVDHLAGASHEERLGRAVALVRRALHRQQPVGLRLGGELLPPAGGRPHALRLLHALALYDPD